MRANYHYNSRSLSEENSESCDESSLKDENEEEDTINSGSMNVKS